MNGYWHMKVGDEIYHPDLGVLKVLDWSDPSLLTVVKKEDERQTPFKIGKQSGWTRILQEGKENSETNLEGGAMAKEGKQKLSTNFLAAHGFKKEEGWASFTPERPLVIVRLKEVTERIGLKSPE